jgi:hypothetical protein
MQTTEPGDGFTSWSKHQMVGVAEQYLDRQRLELRDGHALYCRLRADGHEYGSFNGAVSEVKPSSSSASAGIFAEDLKFHAAWLMT